MLRFDVETRTIYVVPGIYGGCFLVRGSISSFRCEFYDPENESNCFYAVRIRMESPTGFFSIRESDGLSHQILGQSPTTWTIRFSNRKNRMFFNFKMFSTKASSSRTVDELVYCGVPSGNGVSAQNKIYYEICSSILPLPTTNQKA